MGCKDGFASAVIIIKIAFAIVSISMFCNWLAFTTTSWQRNGLGTNEYAGYGLWRQCLSAGGSCGPSDGVGNTKMAVVQAFAIVGFMAQNVGYLLIILYIFKENCRGNSEVRLASAILLFISAAGWLIAVAIYGSELLNEQFNNLYYSYGLAVVACGLGLLGGILVIIGGRGNGHASVGTK